MTKIKKLSMEDIEAIVSKVVAEQLKPKEDETVIEITEDEQEQEVLTEDEDTSPNNSDKESELTKEIESLKKQISEYKELFNTKKESEKPEIKKRTGW